MTFTIALTQTVAFRATNLYNKTETTMGTKFSDTPNVEESTFPRLTLPRPPAGLTHKINSVRAPPVNGHAL